MLTVQYIESLRLGIFAGLACLLYLAESRSKAWTRKQSLRPRRFQNIAIVILNSVIAKFSISAWPVLIAYYASAQNIGFLVITRDMFAPGILIILSYLILDLAIYLQHVAFHNWRWLWPLHAPHHADQDLDFTTGFRFHLFEILLSLLYKTAVVLIMGLHPVGVVLFEIILNASAMFNHANLKLPLWFEDFLGKWIVTPSLHRVHHSRKREECDSNYGFTLVWWDRLFETLIEKSREELEQQEIGLPGYQKHDTPTFKAIMLMPIELYRKKKL